MLITDAKKLSDIQKEFNDKFPFLKIEFYKKPHDAHEGSSERQHVVDVERTIGEVRKVHTKGDLSINGNQMVKTLEQRFFEDYGLNVQVFRRSGDVWLQTTSTDEWSLAEQNEHGKSETAFFEETHETDKEKVA